ncbi:MAG TPA: hypothetical protein VGW78_05280 [Candidatus Babeliales bacterium]|nr:hypothetical protein [Candidatus Babeliales bacterium]
MKKFIFIIGLFFVNNPIICMQLNDIKKIFSLEHIKKRFLKSPDEIKRLEYIKAACEQFNWNNVAPADQNQFKRWSEHYVQSQVINLYKKTIPLTAAALLSGLVGRYTTNNIKTMFYSAAALTGLYCVAKGLETKIYYEEPLDILQSNSSSPAEKSNACGKFLYYNLTNVGAPLTPFPINNVHNLKLVITTLAPTSNFVEKTYNLDSNTSIITEWNWMNSIHDHRHYGTIMNGSFNTMFNSFKEL